MRSQLGRARGLGSAQGRRGPLVGAAADLDRAGAADAVVHLRGGAPGRRDARRRGCLDGGPVPIVLMIALVIATFHHLQLGVQVVIEDYVHGNDVALVGRCWRSRAATLLLALACIVSVLRLGL